MLLKLAVLVIIAVVNGQVPHSRPMVGPLSARSNRPKQDFTGKSQKAGPGESKFQLGYHFSIDLPTLSRVSIRTVYGLFEIFIQ